MKTTWTPPPEMPSNLPALPVGKNGRQLVYIGQGPLNLGAAPHASIDPEYQTKWLIEDELSGMTRLHYAAESDSEICRLNKWGDYDPRSQPKVSTLDDDLPHLLPHLLASNKPAEPAAPLSAVARHIAQMRKEADDAEKDFKDADKAFDEARAWRAQKLAALNDKLEVIAKLEGSDDENIRRAWYSQGRIDGRAHAPSRKTFPLHP